MSKKHKFYQAKRVSKDTYLREHCRCRLKYKIWKKRWKNFCECFSKEAELEEWLGKN